MEIIITLGEYTVETLGPGEAQARLAKRVGVPGVKAFTPDATKAVKARRGRALSISRRV